MFRIQSLLTYKEGKLSGPMSPFLGIQEVAKQLDLQIHGLCRVCFNDDDELMHQFNEGTRSNPSITGHDTLVLKTKYPNTVQYSMFVDTGLGMVPAFMYFSEDYEVVCSEIYQKTEFIKKLTEVEALMIFHEIESKDLAKPVGNLEETVFA